MLFDGSIKDENGEQSRYHFDSFGYALVTVFQVRSFFLSFFS